MLLALATPLGLSEPKTVSLRSTRPSCTSREHAPSARRADAREPGATPQGTSVCESIALVIRGNLGPGALALPYAFARSGWIFGVVAILTVGAQGVWAMLLLAELKQPEVKRRRWWS